MEQSIKGIFKVRSLENHDGCYIVRKGTKTYIAGEISKLRKLINTITDKENLSHIQYGLHNRVCFSYVEIK